MFACIWKVPSTSFAAPGERTRGKVRHARIQQKSETRTSYANFVEVMQSVVGDAKRLDPSLPVLPALAKSADASASSKKRPNNSLRQNGKVPDAIIEAKGFKVGAIIHESGEGNKPHYTITKLNADETTISVILTNADVEYGTRAANVNMHLSKQW